MKQKLFSLLVLLLTAATGAWAQEETYVVKFEANGNSLTREVTLPHKFSCNYDSENDELDMIIKELYGISGFDAEVAPTATGSNKVTTGKTFKSQWIQIDAPFDGTVTVNGKYKKYVNMSAEAFDYSLEISLPHYVNCDWDATTNTGTFDMPASAVVLTPLYAPVAAWAEVESVKQLPAAAEGVFAGTDAPLIKEGTGIVAFAGTSTEVTQGQVMYAVTSTNQATAPALSAFSATVPTAENIADEGADVLVWYYIQGADTPDGQEATAENTFNDSEICATPLEVSVLSNQFDITLNAANANTIEGQNGKGTVTVKTGDADAVDKTADIDENHQLKAVKMGSTVTINAKPGYKFRKVEAKKVAPTLDLATVTTATTVEDGYTLTGTLGASVKISIADGATVTLDGMTINGANDPSCKWAGITCLGDATIILSGTNTVKGFYDEYPGIYVPQNKTLTIQGSGSLTASSNGMGCGIGGGFQIACGNIVIAGGTITATGGEYSAGIGGGYSGGSCGTISITGGTVTANGGQDGAGIGSGSEGGSCGNISITGGTINATGVKYGAGIGSGSDGSCGTVTITNGVTSLTATKGGYAPYSIGPGDSGSCGTVTIGCSLDSNGNIISGTGSTGSITTSPYTYQPSN